MPALPAIGLSRHAPQTFPTRGGGIIEWDTQEWNINWPPPTLPSTAFTWPYTGVVRMDFFIQPVQVKDGTYVTTQRYNAAHDDIEVDGPIATTGVDTSVTASITVAVIAGDPWNLAYGKASGTGAIVISDGADHRSFMSAQYLEKS